MPKPIKIFGDYVVCIDTSPEANISMRKHFIKECGWTPAQFRSIENYAWFMVEVSFWKDGKELAIDYLGACCYKTSDEFHTIYACDYFSDMVHNCALEIKDSNLIAAVDAWREVLNQEKTLAIEKMHAKAEKARARKELTT